jgi:hypothetical protein
VDRHCSCRLVGCCKDAKGVNVNVVVGVNIFTAILHFVCRAYFT